MTTRFRKRPIEVEAVRWDGRNFDEVAAFVGTVETVHGGARPGFQPVPRDASCARVYDKLHDTWVKVWAGQWVVKGVRGEFYPIDQTVLDETYESVAEAVDD